MNFAYLPISYSIKFILKFDKLEPSGNFVSLLYLLALVKIAPSRLAPDKSAAHKSTLDKLALINLALINLSEI